MVEKCFRSGWQLSVIIAAVSMCACSEQESSNSQAYSLAVDSRHNGRFEVVYKNSFPTERTMVVRYSLESSPGEDGKRNVRFVVESATSESVWDSHPGMNNELEVDLLLAEGGLKVVGVKVPSKILKDSSNTLKVSSKILKDSSVPSMSEVYEQNVRSAFPVEYLSITDPEKLLLLDRAVVVGESWDVPKAKAGLFLDLILLHPTGIYFDPSAPTSAKWIRLKCVGKVFRVLEKGKHYEARVTFTLEGRRKLSMPSSGRATLNGVGEVVYDSETRGIQSSSFRLIYDYSGLGSEFGDRAKGAIDYHRKVVPHK